MIEGSDKVIITDNFNTYNGLVIGVNEIALIIEPRGQYFQPLNNKSNVKRITFNDIEKSTITIKIHRKAKDDYELQARSRQKENKKAHKNGTKFKGGSKTSGTCSEPWQSRKAILQNPNIERIQGSSKSKV